MNRDTNLAGFSFKEQRFLVTGASSGIGSHLAKALSSYGARLCIIGRDEDRLNKTLRSLDGEGHSVVRCDLTSEINEIPALIKDQATNHGSFSGAVHCAGIQKPMPIRASSLLDWREVLAINLDVSFMLVKGLGQRKVMCAPSSIVFLSSVMAKAGEPSLSAYCASKSGLEGLVRAASLELRTQNIRVNCVAPAVVKTPMLEALTRSVGSDAVRASEQLHPMGFGELEDVSNAVSYLLSPMSKWVNGTSLVVDGGYLSR